MTVGDRACNRLLGPPVTGTIIKFETAKKDSLDFTEKLWNLLYPDWHKKQIVVLQLDKPSPMYRLDEWLNPTVNENGWLTEDAYHSYVATELLGRLCFPEDDVKVFYF